MRRLQAEDRPPHPDEQAALARWAAWGAIPEVFDVDNASWAPTRRQLRELLDDTEWAAASRTVINAHYTSAEVVEAAWSTLAGLGFKAGRVLEPGCGSGNFIGLAPPGAAVTGVELDPVTAAVAGALYPSAEIRAESFADSRFGLHFDAVIGNVPFGKVVLEDRRHNRSRHSIHNHFLVKSLDLVRPGGLVVVVTSRFTMDARNPAARREMATQADLLGAVRLPGGTFRAASGTDVVTDLVVLRRREPGAEPAGQPWDRVVEVDTPTGTVAINEYFGEHPGQVLGEMGAAHGQYNQADLAVRPWDRPLAEDLGQGLARVTTEARASGLVLAPPSVPPPERSTPKRPQLGNAVVARYHKEGSIVATLLEGGFARITAGLPEPFTPRPKSDRAELAALIGLRDAWAELLESQATNADDAAFGQAQATMGRRYDAYRARYGPLNRFRQDRTGKTDPETGEEVMRRVAPTMGGFARDPDLPGLFALEMFDPVSQEANKAAIFESRVVGPRQAVMGADSATDALALCLDGHARVDLGVIAELLGVDESAARTELGTMVWEDPTTGQLMSAEAYLSGPVRQKLDAARLAANREPRFQAHVEALEAVMPRDLEPGEIDARLGAAWIGATDISEFAREVLATPDIQVEKAEIGATWTVAAPLWIRRNVAMTAEWGTDRVAATKLLEWSLNQTVAKIYDKDDDGTRTLNVGETLAAREKQEALEARFSAWVWEDPVRASRLAQRYNVLFNSNVVPAWEGSHLSLPGLAETFRPHSHQRDAVWRILQEPNVLLAHAVGGGKTAVQVMAGMEMRRLGLARKPAYVVPNHMLEQFSREFLQLYPQARVLVPHESEMKAAGRKQLVARCATGDWDAVILTHSTFGLIPTAPETRAEYRAEKIEALRGALSSSKAGQGLSVKALETKLANAEERDKKLLRENQRDDGVVFEATGIDYVFLDEAHYFKNRAIVTNVADIGIRGSQKAEDLDLKLAWLRSRHGNRAATFATATPVSNTIAEMFNMQRYLQPKTLARAGIADFDSWAATFARPVTAVELSPDGSSYRLKTRMARFANVPELLAMFRAVADVRSTADLGLNIPTVAGGGPETVVVPTNPALQHYMAKLEARAEDIRSGRVDRNTDIMLMVCTDGRKAALDMRLVSDTPDPDPDGGKVAVAAERIAAIHFAHAAQHYPDALAGMATKEPHPRPGALQLVFCDFSTPKEGSWDVYHQLRRELVARGLAPEQVAFIHDAEGTRDKAELFAAARDGRVAVLVGSTAKMGVGTNVQHRAVALHHLDAPWKPAEIEQREGRLLRQGNHNPEVQILRYVTEASFDVYMWQTLERKARFIDQLVHDEVGREADDLGDTVLSFAEVKALASGNPLILQKAGVDSEVAKLSRLARAHHDDQAGLIARRESLLRRAASSQAKADMARSALTTRTETRGDRFVMEVGERSFTKRPEAGDALRQALLAQISARVIAPESPDAWRGFHRGSPPVRVGVLGGFGVTARVFRDRGTTSVEVGLADVPANTIMTSRGELRQVDPLGLISRLERRLARLDQELADALEDVRVAEQEAAQATRLIGGTFPQDQRLNELRRRQAEINQELDRLADTESTDADAPSAEAAEPEPSRRGAPDTADERARAAILAELSSSSQTRLTQARRSLEQRERPGPGFDPPPPYPETERRREL